MPAAIAQTTSFEVASVRPSQRLVGRDYNNQLALSEAGVRAGNVTLKRLVAGAYRLQMKQVLGPSWLDQNEYVIQAQAGRPVSQDEVTVMLRSLLADRFALKHHSEIRNMRIFELTADKAGPKIQPMKVSDERAKEVGFHFHGDMRQLADVIAVQLTIPAPMSLTVPATASVTPLSVLDKTGLSGIYDFNVDVSPEAGADGFTIWKRVLREQLGLKLDSRRADVPVLVIDNALRIPTEN
jgi:uncharacterized protein (TIGR03435 family)